MGDRNKEDDSFLPEFLHFFSAIFFSAIFLSAIFLSNSEIDTSRGNAMHRNFAGCVKWSRLMQTVGAC